MAKRDYAKACKAFEASFEVEAAIGTQLNLGLCRKLLGRPVDSYRAYVTAFEMATKAGDDRIGEIRKTVDESRRHIARIKVNAPDGAKLTLDDVEIDAGDLIDGEIVVEPGTHELEVSFATETVTERLTLRGGERKLLRYEAPKVIEPERAAPAAVAAVGAPPTTKVERRTGGLVVGSLALIGGSAALGYGGYLLYDARKSYRSVDCPDHVCATQQDVDTTRDAKARARTSTYVIAGGVTAVVLGVVLMATSKKREPRFAVGPLVSNGFGIAVGGSL